MRRPFLVVLGIAQDAGLPQAGCRRACCIAARRQPRRRRHAVSLGIVDPGSRSRWIVDATPDFREQLAHLERCAPSPSLEGVFLTHGHIGHYTGLVNLGREAMSARAVPVHAMPRMTSLLRRNAPWEQLVRLHNIELRPLRAGVPVTLRRGLTMTPFLVPHRAEYTETVGYRVTGPRRCALWLPDIDRWDEWPARLEDVIEGVDAAWLDATFYGPEELPDRPAAEVPHPFLSDTLDRLSALPAAQRKKVRFIHLNHTNPAHDPRSEAARRVKRLGMSIGREGETFAL